METGYFGIPGNNGNSSTKVHLVENDKPVCGATLGKNQVFQWCARNIRWDYLECENCKRIARKLLNTLPGRIPICPLGTGERVKRK